MDNFALDLTARNRRNTIVTRISRRQLVGGGLAGLGWLAGGNQLILAEEAQPTAQTADLHGYLEFLRAGSPHHGAKLQSEAPVTLPQILGPYHRENAPFRGKVTPPFEPGRVLLVRGRVFGANTKAPLAGAVLDVWQANAEGHYDMSHPEHRTRTQHRGTRTRTRSLPLRQLLFVGSIESASTRSVSELTYPVDGNRESSITSQTLFAIALSDVQWDRLRSAKPLVTSLSINAAQRLGDAIRERDVINGETVNVESFVVENRWRHRGPFEYEYEYRCTEYEYDSPGRDTRDLLSQGTGEDGDLPSKQPLATR
jgi:hypothetical protein